MRAELRPKLRASSAWRRSISRSTVRDASEVAASAATAGETPPSSGGAGGTTPPGGRRSAAIRRAGLGRGSVGAGIPPPEASGVGMPRAASRVAQTESISTGGGTPRSVSDQLGCRDDLPDVRFDGPEGNRPRRAPRGGSSRGCGSGCRPRRGAGDAGPLGGEVNARFRRRRQPRRRPSQGRRRCGRPGRPCRRLRRPPQQRCGSRRWKSCQC